MARSIGEGGKHASLSGFWTGGYWYSGMVPAPLSGGAPFNAFLQEDSGAVSGTTLERNTFAMADLASGELSAVINGHRHGSEITFTKIYDPAPGVHRTPIRYAGTVDPILSRIEGEWWFDDPTYPRGGFRLDRLSGGLEAARRELVEVKLSLPGRRRRR